MREGIDEPIDELDHLERWNYFIFLIEKEMNIQVDEEYPLLRLIYYGKKLNEYYKRLKENGNTNS